MKSEETGPAVGLTGENVRVLGLPQDGRIEWGQDPDGVRLALATFVNIKEDDGVEYKFLAGSGDVLLVVFGLVNYLAADDGANIKLIDKEVFRRCLRLMKPIVDQISNTKVVKVSGRPAGSPGAPAG